MIQKLLTGWNFMRLLRLALGIIIIIQGILVKDWMYILMGLLFSLLPIFNIGCCGATACNTNSIITSKQKEESSFEEIKNK